MSLQENIYRILGNQKAKRFGLAALALALILSTAGCLGLGGSGPSGPEFNEEGLVVSEPSEMLPTLDQMPEGEWSVRETSAQNFRTFEETKTNATVTVTIRVYDSIDAAKEAYNESLTSKREANLPTDSAKFGDEAVKYTHGPSFLIRSKNVVASSEYEEGDYLNRYKKGRKIAEQLAKNIGS